MATMLSVYNKNRALLCNFLSILLRSCSLLRAWSLVTVVLMTGLLSACQPPTSTTTSATADSSDAEDAPIIINANSVIMAPEYILNIKTSRYQPSLGLQGNIEPIKQARLTAAQDLRIQQVLVTKSQWVEKGTPLLIVQRQALNKSTTNASTAKDSDASADDRATANTAHNEPLPDDLSIKAPNKPSLKNTAESNTKDFTAQEAVTPKDNSKQLIIISASFSGRVDDVYVETMQHVNAGKPLLHLKNDTDLHFIATLPIQAEPQLSVGQTVNFTTKGMAEKFSGQVSKLLVRSQSGQLLVYVQVIKNEVSRGRLQPNMAVTGRVNYGQIEVGTIVPERGLHEVDLTEVQQPPYRPLSPLTANVWIIKQDQRLTRQPVEVIEYDPSTGQYLIAGISNDSLICLADLPLESAGKKVVIS